MKLLIAEEMDWSISGCMKFDATGLLKMFAGTVSSGLDVEGSMIEEEVAVDVAVLVSCCGLCNQLNLSELENHP